MSQIQLLYSSKKMYLLYLKFWFSFILDLANLAFLFQSQLRQGSIEQHVKSALLTGAPIQYFSPNIFKGFLSGA